jgi:iron complex outermembrane recepter protein
VMQLLGTDVNSLAPQQSRNMSFGFELIPGSMPKLKIGVNYYRIEYSDRIASPGTLSVMLGNPSDFVGLIVRNPSVDQVNSAITIGSAGGTPPFLLDDNFMPIPIDDFDAGSVDVLVDQRIRNLSKIRTDGIDVSLQYGFEAAGGDIALGLNGTYIFERLQQVTSNSAPADRVDTIYNPPNVRVRGSLGWQHKEWTANVFVNHVDSYSDIRTTPVRPVSSHTTVDVRVAHDFGLRIKDGFLSGVTASFSVQNLFDKDPPPVAVITARNEMGFDPTNADPMGRLLAFELTKAWGHR